MLHDAFTLGLRLGCVGAFSQTHLTQLRWKAQRQEFVLDKSDNDPQVRSYVHSFILGTDKALRAYNAGRILLLKYTQFRNSTVLLLHGLSEFETCITTVKRCLSLADRMASHPENPEIERTVRRLLDSYQRTVRPIRDAIEHMDEDIARGEVRPGTLSYSRSHKMAPSWKSGNIDSALSRWVLVFPNSMHWRSHSHRVNDRLETLMRSNSLLQGTASQRRYASLRCRGP